MLFSKLILISLIIDIFVVVTDYRWIIQEVTFAFCPVFIMQKFDALWR